MLGEPARLTFALDAGFREMEREQPALSTFVADEIAEISDPCLSALAYFLAVVLFMAFRDAFPGRLTAVQAGEIKQMLDRLVTDGELRETGAAVAHLQRRRHRAETAGPGRTATQRSGSCTRRERRRARRSIRWMPSTKRCSSSCSPQLRGRAAVIGLRHSS